MQSSHAHVLHTSAGAYTDPTYQSLRCSASRGTPTQPTLDECGGIHTPEPAHASESRVSSNSLHGLHPDPAYARRVWRHPHTGAGPRIGEPCLKQLTSWPSWEGPRPSWPSWREPCPSPRRPRSSSPSWGEGPSPSWPSWREPGPCSRSSSPSWPSWREPGPCSRSSSPSSPSPWLEERFFEDSGNTQTAGRL